MRERDILARYVKPLAQHFPEALGLNDDAALLQIPAGMELIVTTDMMREGVHFLRNASAGNVAWKLMAANLSDIAAMGGEAHSYQLALCLTGRQDESWIKGFTEALAEIQNHYGISLSGGDTIRSQEGLTASVTMHGLVEKGRALRRSTAQAGDFVYVTGTLGDAALGLAIAEGQVKEIAEALAVEAMQRYWRPTPRLHIGQQLRGIANACMDISDGLLVDCQKLCEASGVGATIDYASLPLSEIGIYIKAHYPETFLRCISAGDDYELLLTVPEEKSAILQQKFSLSNTRITCIGRVITEPMITLLNSEGNPMSLPVSGYEH